MDQISELMDGELDARRVREQVARMNQNEELLHCWDTFHLVGDVMRGERVLPQGFTHRLSARLAKEPTVLAPHRSALRRIATYTLSAAASLSAVAVVGWLAFFNNPLVPQPDLAKAPVTIVPAAAPSLANAPVAALPAAARSAQLASVPNDGRMSEYLIAHQEFSPSTAIQGLAPYIRSVSSTQQAPER